MTSSKTHIGLAIGVVVIGFGVLAWLNADVLAGWLGKSGSAQVAGAGHEGHGHEAGEDADHEEDEHGHDAHGQANRDPAEIEQARCEHDIRTIDCDECRYELGVVKVEPSVTDALTKTAQVRNGRISRALRLTGEVQYDETRLVDVLPVADGRVVAVHARLGQHVRKGDVLAVIHSGDLGEAKAAYLEALALKEVAAQEEQRQLKVFESLEKLLNASKRERADGLDGEVLGEWKSKLVGALARLRQAKATLDREKTLVAKRASSKAELEAAQREMETAQADYTALLEEIQLNIHLDRLKAKSADKLAAARLDAAEQRLYLFGLDDEAICALPQRKENGRFAQLQITAPRDGVVTKQDLTEGRFVEKSYALYTIADTSNVWVWCDLYERDLGLLHERLARGEKPQAQVRVAAFDETFIGVVDLLGSTVDETTRTVKVRVQVRNEGGKLRPGMFASVDISLQEAGTVALVPRYAVMSDEGQTFAFVHWKDDLWLRRDVRVGRCQGEMVEILSGLAAGEKVVAGGGFLFKSDVLRAKMGAGCAD